jgi:hypothetical protein
MVDTRTYMSNSVMTGKELVKALQKLSKAVKSTQTGIANREQTWQRKSRYPLPGWAICSYS